MNQVDFTIKAELPQHPQGLQDCPTCRRRGHVIEYWYDESGGAPWVLRPTCRTCQGAGVISPAAAFVLAFVTGAEV